MFCCLCFENEYGPQFASASHMRQIFFFYCVLCAEKRSTTNNWKIVSQFFVPSLESSIAWLHVRFFSANRTVVLHGGVCHQSFQFHHRSKFPARVTFLLVFRQLYYRRRRSSSAIQLLLFFVSFVVVVFFFFFFFFSSSSSSFSQKCSELGAAGCVPLSVLT